MTSAKFQIGIDLGGTKIESILLTPDGSTAFRKRVPTPLPGYSAMDGQTKYAAICISVQDAILEACAHIPQDVPYSVGVGIPGTIDPETGLVQNANITCLSGRAFCHDLEQRLSRPIGMENDANCFTLAETRNGAAKGYNLVFGLILGTGCGGGICINGRIHRGRHAIAGEWGHFCVDPAGDTCFCGNCGCLETKISGSGVSAALYKKNGRVLPLEQITAGYRQGDPDCRPIFEQFIDDFGRGVGGLISLLDPDAVVMGGGVSNIDELYTLGLEKIRRYAYHRHVETPILKNKLGDSAGVFGAAWIGKG